MGAAPRFSIIIPTYNRPVETQIAVRSCLDQTFEDFELIVVDDGSSPAFVLDPSCADARVRVIHAAKNSGQCAACNLGLSDSRGQYVCFLDSDDTWLPDKLAQLDATIAARGNPADVVFFSHLRIDMGRGRVVDYENPDIRPDEDVLKYLFFRKGVMQTSTLAVSAPMARRVGFREQFDCHSDYDFVWQLHLAGAQFYLVDQVLATWVCDVRDDRASNRSAQAVRTSQRWIADIRPDLDKAILRVLQAKLVVRWIGRRRPLWSVAILADALRLGAIDWRYFISTLVVKFFGSRAHARLKRSTVGESTIYT